MRVRKEEIDINGLFHVYPVISQLVEFCKISPEWAEERKKGRYKTAGAEVRRSVPVPPHR